MALRSFGTSLAGTTTGGTGVKNGVTAPIDGTAAPRARFTRDPRLPRKHCTGWLTLPRFRSGRVGPPLPLYTFVGTGSKSALALWPQLLTQPRARGTLGIMFGRV